MTEPVLVNAPAKSDNKRVIKMGAIGGVLVLSLLVLPKLLGGGGGGGEEVVSPTPGATPTSIAPAPGGGGGGGGGGFSAGGGGGGGRNPFTALVSDTSQAGGDGLPGAAVPPDTSGLAALPPIDLGGDTAGTGGDAGAPSTPATTIPPRQTHRLSLLEVYSTQSGITGARVRVDDDVMETTVGQDFGGNYRTVSLDRQSGCGVFLFGDQRITLCEGQEAQT